MPLLGVIKAYIIIIKASYRLPNKAINTIIVAILATLISLPF